MSPGVAKHFAMWLKNCRVEELGAGIHYLQEDHPEVIGKSIKEWLVDVGVDSYPEQKLTL